MSYYVKKRMKKMKFGQIFQKLLIKKINLLAVICKNCQQIFKYDDFSRSWWTDDYRKISYISLTVHYMDETWQIKDQILAASKFPDVRHTAGNIKKVILGILKSYNLVPDSSMERYMFVTDSAANFISEFKGLNHIPCFVHR